MRAFCLFVCFWWDYRIVDFTISTKGNVPAPLGSLNQIDLYAKMQIIALPIIEKLKATLNVH